MEELNPAQGGRMAIYSLNENIAVGEKSQAKQAENVAQPVAQPACRAGH